MITHISFNTASQFGGSLASTLRRFENSFNDLNELFSSLTLMRDNDGSAADDYALIQQKIGATDNAGAKAVYDELSSVLFKLNTDSSVTEVNAAMRQVFNKLRQS